MRYILVRLALSVLRLLPSTIVNEVLHRYAPDEWGADWQKGRCLTELESLLMER